jgi:transcriptional regulator with XRE-family HTH domain
MSVEPSATPINLTMGDLAAPDPVYASDLEQIYGFGSAAMRSSDLGTGWIGFPAGAFPGMDWRTRTVTIPAIMQFKARSSWTDLLMSTESAGTVDSALNRWLRFRSVPTRLNTPVNLAGLYPTAVLLPAVQQLAASVSDYFADLTILFSSHFAAPAVQALASTLSEPIDAMVRFVSDASLAQPPIAVSDTLAPSHVDVEPHLRAFRELTNLLGISSAQLGDLVGIGRTTPYAWERSHRRPRIRTVRRLYQVHALVSTLANRLGPTDYREWITSQTPSPRDLVLEGRLDEVVAMARETLFGRSHQPALSLGAATNEQTPRPRTSQRRVTAEIDHNPDRPLRVQV